MIILTRHSDSTVQSLKKVTQIFRVKSAFESGLQFPHKFRHLSPGLWGELVSDNFMISIEAIAHGLSLSIP